MLGAYATNMVAPAMPVVIQKGKIFISLFALDVNGEFNYPKYFSVLPTGPETKASFTEGFFQVAMQQNPKPQTVALAAADAEFSQNACEGARENAKKHGMKIVYDKSYPAAAPPTSRRSCARSRRPIPISSWFAPIRSTRSAWCWRPTRSGYKPKMFGGAMVGLQATVFKDKLGPSSMASSTTRPGCRTTS